MFSKGKSAARLLESNPILQHYEVFSFLFSAPLSRIYGNERTMSEKKTRHTFFSPGRARLRQRRARGSLEDIRSHRKGRRKGEKAGFLRLGG